MPVANRLRLLKLGLLAWAAIVVVRLATVQILQHGSWSREAEEQQERTVEVAEPRGDIVTRDGRILAGSLERVAVGINPRRLSRAQWRPVAARLAPIVGVSEAEILARLRDASGFFYLAKDLDPKVAPAIARLGGDAVWTERSERRVYPNGAFAGPVTGFLDAEGVGQAGLEEFFESTLRGVPSTYRLVRDGRSVGTPLELWLEKAGRPGLSLRLTIDSRIQLVVEEELARTVAEIGARDAAAVVMDPATGQLLAIASLPAYDPGHPGQAKPEWRRNRAVEDALEPGSTFKPIVVAAALTAGVLQPHELVNCSGGGVQIGAFFIRDHARFGLLPVREVIAQSSNTGAIRIAYRIAPGQLDATIRALGFGAPTGVELPSETRGLYHPPERWSALSRAGLALGQELSVSPVQLAQAYAAVANGGVLVRPTLVLETVDGRTGRVVTPYRAQPGRRVLSPEIAAQVADMLQAVVDEGTGKTAAVAGYAVMGKTGTAQRAYEGSYRAGRHAAWFAGFFPREQPRVVMVVCVNQPGKTYWAAEVAAPTFGRIAARLATLLGLEPREGNRA